jgi:uncharacterized protein YndB with AHSA1/START domain
MNDRLLQQGAMPVDAQRADPQKIVVDEIFPHAPELVWKALTDGALMGRWIMAPTGFAPVVGNRFTYQTTPAGAWDGTIQCEVLEVVPLARFSYAWRGGDAGNVGYGAPLDTVVTFTLAKVAGGTRLRLVHEGFVLPRNDSAFQKMGQGWPKVMRGLGAMIDDSKE